MVARCLRTPYRTSRLKWNEYADELLCGRAEVLYGVTRLHRDTFGRLRNLVASRGWLRDTHNVKEEERLLIFIVFAAGALSFRQLGERFQGSLCTFHKYGRTVCYVL